MNTYKCQSGREWQLIPGKTYDKDGVEHQRAGHVSTTVAEPIAGKATVPGLTVNACPTWARGRTIALRGGDSGGQARLSVADDLPALVEILTEDLPELFGAWETLDLEAKVLAPITPTPTPTVAPVEGLAALKGLLAEPADPWAAVRAVGADDELIAALIARNVTPEEAIAAMNA